MQSDPSDGGPSQFRLLVCDDSSAERTALAEILRRRGYQVDEAADGSAALLYLKNTSHDLLLLDLQMPDIDGFDVLAYVQTHRPQLPVVLLSGMPPDEIGDGLQRLPSAELPPLLLKPIDSRQLFQVIELRLAGELP
jgi:two-component system, OmpR family, response regulator PrrA